MSETKTAIKTAPKTIWLQIGDDEAYYDDPFPYGEEVTWCQDPVQECEIEYTRADISSARIKELEGALNDIKETTEHLWFSQANQGDKPLQEHKLIWVPKVMDIANKALKSTQEK